jgi:ribonucleoside-diphosphate reductase alpha chain
MIGNELYVELQTELDNLKAVDEAPEWLTIEGLGTLKSGYFLEGETPKGMWRRVSDTAAGYYRNVNLGNWTEQELSNRFFELFWKGWLGGASPVLANMGTDRGFPISCFASYVGDNRDSIFSSFEEIAWISSMGGGTAVHVSDIRGRGAKISSGGVSSGVVPWLKIFDSLTVGVNQCYGEGTEVLTQRGWVEFKNLTDSDLVLQANNNKTTSFTKPLNYFVYDVEEELEHFYSDDKSVNLYVTFNHKMVLERRKRVTNKILPRGLFFSHKKEDTRVLELVEAKDVSYHRDVYHYFTFPTNAETTSLSPKEQFLIAYQADGTSKPRSSGALSGKYVYDFHFSKQRKVKRLKNILERCNYDYKVDYPNDSTTQITVWLDFNPVKDFSWIDFSQVSKVWAKEFVEELGHWDGSFISNNGIQYATTNKLCADQTQAVATLAGYKTRILVNKRKEGEGRLDCYQMIVNPVTNRICGTNVFNEKVAYKGKVYCVEVQSGMLVVRYKDSVAVCGNSSFRRGALAAYYDIEGEDFDDFLKMRQPHGDPNLVCTNIHHAVVIKDSFMKKLQAGDKQSKKRWAEVLQKRKQTGEPYLFFIDTVNNNNPDCYKALALDVKGSNLCDEIVLHTSELYTLVCCLSSLNAAKYDEWKEVGASVIRLSILLLDAVIEEFITKAKGNPNFEKALRFAEESRAVGLGVMGYHTLLQKRNLPFASPKARELNIELFKLIGTESRKASHELAFLLGEPKWCRGFGVRNTHTNALAPTKSNSTICGNVSEGIEPYLSNYFVKDTKGAFIQHNPQLIKLLKELGQNKKEVLASISNNGGSVKHLDFLSDHQKEVFKTAHEIDQLEIIQQAADRQRYIDQSQSLNLFIREKASMASINKIHFTAWKLGVKSLYYQKGEPKSRASSEVDYSVLTPAAAEVCPLTKPEDGEVCIPCQG